VASDASGAQRQVQSRGTGAPSVLSRPRAPPVGAAARWTSVRPTRRPARRRSGESGPLLAQAPGSTPNSVRGPPSRGTSPMPGQSQPGGASSRHRARCPVPPRRSRRRVRHEVDGRSIRGTPREGPRAAAPARVSGCSWWPPLVRRLPDPEWIESTLSPAAVPALSRLCPGRPESCSWWKSSPAEPDRSGRTLQEAHTVRRRRRSSGEAVIEFVRWRRRAQGRSQDTAVPTIRDGCGVFGAEGGPNPLP